MRNYQLDSDGKMSPDFVPRRGRPWLAFGAIAIVSGIAIAGIARLAQPKSFDLFCLQHESQCAWSGDRPVFRTKSPPDCAWPPRYALAQHSAVCYPVGGSKSPKGLQCWHPTKAPRGAVECEKP